MAVCGIYYTKASYINDLPWLEFQTASLAGVPQRGQREREIDVALTAAGSSGKLMNSLRPNYTMDADSTLL